MRWPTAILVLILLFLYLRSPIDLVPDRLGAVGLLDDLVFLLVTGWWLWRRLGSPVPGNHETRSGGAKPRAAEWNPHAVLGVPRGAAPEEIARAYRERMKEYHPDRVATLGPELQELAHRKTLDIQRAYAELRQP